MASYSKTYQDDIYFFLPMTATNKEETQERLVRDRKNRLFSAEGHEDPTFGEIYCDTLTNHCLYECNSKVFKQLARIHLGEFELACYDDNYDGTVIDVEKVDLFVTAHYRTGIFLVTLACVDNHYIPTQLIDQMSTQHLDIKDPESGEFVSIRTYMRRKYLLDTCGEAKCVICMSNHPENPDELGYILAGETCASEHIDYKILPHRLAPLLECRAYYDYYDSYISRSVVAFVFKDYPDDIEERLETEASEIFIVEIVLFQNTAVMRTNNRVIEELDENDGITNEEIEELYVEFGRTMKFWSSNVFKYTFAQKEADSLIEAFEIKKTLDEYRRNQDFLDKMVELKANIEDQKSNLENQKSDERMNVLLFILSCFEGCSIFLAAMLYLFAWAFPNFKEGSLFEHWSSVVLCVIFFGASLLFFLHLSGKISFKRKKKPAGEEPKPRKDK